MLVLQDLYASFSPTEVGNLVERDVVPGEMTVDKTWYICAWRGSWWWKQLA